MEHLTMHRAIRQMVIAASMLAACALATAADDIVIGQTADLSSVAAGGQTQDFNAGVKLYLDAVNSRGGIAGRRIRLFSLDDAYVAINAAKNAETLAANQSVVALFGSRGSDPTDAVIKVAEREQMALIAPVNGADAVRASKVVFPVRASYKAEVDGVLRYFSLAPTKLAVLVQDDKFGRPLLDYIEQQLKNGKHPNISLVGKVIFDRKATRLDSEVEKIIAMRARAVVALCNPAACSEFVNQLQERTEEMKELRPAVAQLSNIDMLAQYKLVGGSGVLGNPFAQVLPSPYRASLPISRDFTAAATAHKVPINYRSFEGYVSAAVMVEGLRRAKTLTRQGIRDGMEGLGEISIGGIAVKYTATDRTGSRLVDLVSMDSQGRLLR
ncbi:MAG: ABC transporter substrate-binding protein [Burkholderiales bacterium]|nr:ABC transporter substrate-binding protein [Burkholderiales bacterium]